VIGLVFVMSSVLMAARLSVEGAPTGAVFVVLVRAIAVGGVGVGLVMLVDRISARMGSIHVRASIPSPAPPPPQAPVPSSDSMPSPPTLHRGGVAGLGLVMCLLGLDCGGSTAEVPALRSTMPRDVPLSVPSAPQP
jgi:hypothetical protein